MWWDCNVKHLPGQDMRPHLLVAELSRSLIKAARCARRWPGVSAGLCLGGPPGARRAATSQGMQLKSAHAT